MLHTGQRMNYGEGHITSFTVSLFTSDKRHTHVSRKERTLMFYGFYTSVIKVIPEYNKYCIFCMDVKIL